MELPMTNYVFIGDVHSQYTKFAKAVEWVHNNVEDYHIIQGGDLFDSRTTESLSVEVFELVQQLQDKITVINSNHLWKLYRILTDSEFEFEGDCIQRTLDDFLMSKRAPDKDFLVGWLQGLPNGVAIRDHFGQEYRVCHAYWFSKLYVPSSYDGIYKISPIVSAKARGQLLYGLSRKDGSDVKRLEWWNVLANHKFVRVSFHYHTISIDPFGATGNKHIILDGSCGSDGGVLPVYDVTNRRVVTF